jgi:Chaperone of endosialidase
MKLNSYKIYYEGNDYSGNSYDMTDAIGLGFPCNDPLPGKLSVNQAYISGNVNQPTIAGYFKNNDKTTSATTSFKKHALLGICNGLSTSDPQISLFALMNVGGEFQADNSEQYNIGVIGLGGLNPDVNYGNHNIGGYFESGNANYENIAVYALATSGIASSSYGIYAYGDVAGCSTGTCPYAAGYFDGDLYHSGGIFTTSDSKFKSNIISLENSISIIKSLNPVSFKFNTAQYPKMNLPVNDQKGLIAQELQTVLPELVKEFKAPSLPDGNGGFDTTGRSQSFLSVNYVGLIPYLIGAIKEQQQMIDSLMNELLEMQTEIKNCCSASGTNLRLRNPVNSIQLANSIILNQNDPNPFAEETRITYYIPESYKDAKLIFFDKANRVIQTVKINERGEGELIVYASNLSSGVYNYSLIVDGVLIETKKMVCTK